MKPGYLTTEFWLSVGTTAIGFLAVIFGWNVAQSTEMVTAWHGAVVAVAGLLANAAVLWKYIDVRETLKTTEMMVQHNPQQQQEEEEEDGGVDMERTLIGFPVHVDEEEEED